MKQPAIHTSDLSKAYDLGHQKTTSFRDYIGGLTKGGKKDHFWALRDVSFELSAGEVLGIVGPNGAGKSTLLKILSGITFPSKGEARIRGRVASLLEIGTGFHPDLTGRENVFLNGAILGMKGREIRSKFDEIVAFSGIEPFIDTRVKYYSTGMYLRLAFSVAAFLESDILLIDEVIAVGDLEFQQNCFRKIEESHRSGKAIIMVSHEMSYIKQLCPRTLWLQYGAIQADGPTNEVLSAYIHASTEHRPARTEIEAVGLGHINSIRLMDGNDRAVQALMSGSAYNFEFELHTAKAERREIQVRLFVRNALGGIVLTMSNIFTGETLEGQANRFRIRCQWPRLPLNDGRYSIELHIKDHRIAWQRFDHVLTFDVIKGPYYPTGMAPKYGLLTDYSWSIH